MAYVTGSASSFADLKTAIENAAVANGWALSSTILSKDGCFVKLTTIASEIEIAGGNGQSGSTLTDVPDGTAKSAKIVNTLVDPMSFPINYEIHLFANPNEVYCIINFNSNYYMQLSFGQSDVHGIGGSGNWFSSAFNSSANLNSPAGIVTTTTINNTRFGFQRPAAGNMCGLFADESFSFISSFIHCGLDSVEWLDVQGTALAGNRLGASYCASLINSLPNAANQSAVLVPIKCIKPRTSGGLTAVANLKNARYTVIDNLNPGEIITYGSDQWKIYPFLRKNSAIRGGVGTSTGADHTGTLGYAIRYTGT